MAQVKRSMEKNCVGFAYRERVTQFRENDMQVCVCDAANKKSPYGRSRHDPIESEPGQMQLELRIPLPTDRVCLMST